jgi:crotonobetainyl-CoA:carnitine CoA-transferase CaiB-like acyl-CoA transferase
MAGLFGAASVVGAIMERRETGKGRDLRIGLFENCLLLVAQHMVQFELEGVSPPPMPERDFSWPVYDIFTTGDAKQLFVGAVTEGQWGTLCDILRLDELKADPRLQTRMDCIKARSWTIPIVTAAMAKRSASDLMPAFEAAGIPFAPIAKPSDMFKDPHVMRPGGLAVSRMADGRQFRAPSLPVEVDGEMVRGGGDVAAVGQDTDAILGELGLDPEAIAAARGNRA